MKVAYADPPYIGLANYYPEKTEVDHLELVKFGFGTWKNKEVLNGLPCRGCPKNPAISLPLP